MVTERPKRHISAPTNEAQVATLTESCERTFTSPTALARLRGGLSRFILDLPPNDPGAYQLAALEPAKHIFCPDELAVLRELQTPLPEPWKPGKTIKTASPVDIIAEAGRPWLTEPTFIPSAYEFDKLIDLAVDSSMRVGVYFMVTDVINAGHLDALAQARESGECDFLALILTTDLLTAGMKSTSDDPRPKLPFHQRIYMASQTKVVDAIYAVPTGLTPAHIVFELASLAIAYKKLGVRLNNQDEDYAPPLDLEIIKSAYPGGWWQTMCSQYLGFPPARSSDLDRWSAFYQQKTYPPGLQIPYRYLWVKWFKAARHHDDFTLFTSDHDPEMAQFHIHQALQADFNFQVGPKIVQISTRCPHTSSSFIFQNHSLRSEAEQENLRTLRMLKAWEAEKDPQWQLFSDWENPLLHPVPEYAWLTS
jgi:hypothetical protein